MTRRGLLDWLVDPARNQGVNFAREGEEWAHWSYLDLARMVIRFAGGLQGRKVGRGQTVLTVLPSGPEFVAALFGAMAAGAVPCPVAPPMLFQSPASYAAHLGGVAAAAHPAAVVTSSELRDRLAALVPGSPVMTASEVTAACDLEPSRLAGAPGDLALLQFTSGSSGMARGVRVPFGALEANISAIRKWLGMTPSDPTVTWLPVHHDMGLIGCFLTPIVNQSDLWVFDPERFVRSPLRYVRSFDRGGGRLSAMPAFGLDHIARRVRPESLEGLDLSEWKALVVGAERIDPVVLERFAALLSPFGFSRRAFRPAYGLAEATLAVTGVGLAEEWRTVDADPRVLALGEVVAGGRARRDAPATEERGDGLAGLGAVTGCGRPLEGVEVEIVDEDGAALPEGHLGQIVVRGPSVASGYADATDSCSPTTLSAGILHSGDAGFLLDGELFVIGRLGDSMKVRGRTVFAEDIEAALVQKGIPRNRLAALLGSTPAGCVVVVLIERAEQQWVTAGQDVLRRLADGADGYVFEVPRGTIERTTSGKPKRRPLWRAVASGGVRGAALPGATVSA